MDQWPTHAGRFSMDEKVYPWGLPPIVSFRPRHLHVIPLYQSGSREDSLKHAALLVFHSFLTDQPSHSRWLRRWKLSFSRLCNSWFFLVCWKRCGTFPWESRVWAPCSGEAAQIRWPVCHARCHGMTLSSEHWIARCIAVKWLVNLIAFAPSPFILSRFFSVCSGFPRSRVSSTSPLAHPPKPFSSTMSIELGGTFLCPNLFVLTFILVSLTTLEDKPVCHT